MNVNGIILINNTKNIIMNRLKFFVAPMVAVMFSLPAMSGDLWGRQKTFKIGMAFNSLHINPVEIGYDKELGCTLNPNYGFSLGLTKTYFVHKQPIGGFMRFGIEATWFDITYTNYSNTVSFNGSNWDPDDYNYVFDYGNGGDYDYDDEEDDVPSIGNHQVDLAMGVGVSATFAPFYKMNKNLAALKGKIYCNFMPTASLLMQSNEDENNLSVAFVPFVTFGTQISWKVLSVFVEGRWGASNYKFLLSDDEEETTKNGGRNAGVRVGIGLSF